MALPKYENTGTISVANGATSVTGTGTIFASAVRADDRLTVQGLSVRIASVESNTALTLAEAWPGTSLTDDAYEISITRDGPEIQLRTRELLEQMRVIEANGRGLFYTFSTTTTDADPTPGYLRLNNGTQSSATAGYLDNLDANGATVATIIDTWDDSTSTTKGQLWIRGIENPANFRAYNVTGSVVDGTGYRKLTLTHVGGSGSFAADDELMVFFSPTGAKGDNSSSDLVTHTFPGTGGAARTVYLNLNKFPSPEDYGADPTGGGTAATNLAAFNNCLAQNGYVFLPSNKSYLVNGTINVATGQAIYGEGADRALITSNSASLPIISVADGAVKSRLEGFMLTKSVTATSGGDGIKFVGTTDQTRIQDVRVENCYNGMTIGTTDVSYLEDVRLGSNINHGINLAAQVAYSVAQWKIARVLSSRNGGDGIKVTSPVGTAGMILGTWMNIETFANSGRGIHLVGNATTPIYDLRLSDSFIGSDALACIRLDTHGANHLITGCFLERAGRDPTGPALATGATGTGYGVVGTTSNKDLTLVGNLIDNNSYAGVYWEGSELVASGNRIVNNGASVGAERRGMLVATGTATITGNRIGNTTGVTTQTTAVGLGTTTVTITGNDMTGSSAKTAGSTPAFEANNRF